MSSPTAQAPEPTTWAAWAPNIEVYIISKLGRAPAGAYQTSAPSDGDRHPQPASAVHSTRHCVGITSSRAPVMAVPPATDGDCGHCARSTAPASPFARFPTSGEESELRATLRTHSRTFGTAGQVLGRGPNDPTAAVVLLALADLSHGGARTFEKKTEKGCHTPPRTKKSDL